MINGRSIALRGQQNYDAVSLTQIRSTNTCLEYGGTQAVAPEVQMSKLEAITVEHDGPVAVITLCRPEVLNALNSTLQQRVVHDVSRAGRRRRDDTLS